MLGALAGAAFKAVAPNVAEYGAKYAAGRYVAGRVANFVAGSQGQRLAGRVVGSRFASALATPTGQTAVKFATAKAVRNPVEGDPTTTTIKQNKQYDASNPNLTGPATPGSALVGTPGTPSSAGQGQMSGAQMRNYARLQRAQQQSGGGKGWMGTGKGWWEQNSQITQQDAFAGDVSKLGDFSVARGIDKPWPLSGAARGAVALGMGMREGYQRTKTALEPHEPTNREPQPYGMKGSGNKRTSSTGRPASHASTGTKPTEGTGEMKRDAYQQSQRRARFSAGAGETQEADVVEHHLTDVRNVPGSGSLDPYDYNATYQGMGTQVGGRTSNFQIGSGTPSIGGSTQLALGPGPTPTPVGTQPSGQQYWDFGGGIPPPNPRRRRG